jgi:hypothetical protein
MPGGMRGPFEARRFSLQVWFSRHQFVFPAGIAISFAILLAACIR